MGHDPKQSERRARLGKAERAAAQEKMTAKQSPLPDLTTTVTHTPPKPRRTYSDEHGLTGTRLHDIISLYSDGVMKICPTENPLICYLYWRWSRGRWAGHYVCVLCSSYELSIALGVLVSRIEEVQTGQRRPTRDRYQG